jgi:hypothetical protein
MTLQHLDGSIFAIFSKYDDQDDGVDKSVSVH